MTRQSTIGLRMALQALMFVMGALAIGALIPFANARGDLRSLVGGFVVVATLSVLFIIPARILPTITLLATLVVPSEATQLPHHLQGSALGLMPLAVWMIRAPRTTNHTPLILRLLASLFGVWLVLSEIFAPLHTHRGSEWTVTVAVALVFTVISAPGGLKARDFRALFLAITTVLGMYALLEGFVLHRNVLFGPLFEHTSWWASQHYNVSYRVTTLLGHPLFNGLVFSAAAVLAASDLVQRSHRPLVALVRFMILVGATDATHSRSAVIALVVGVVSVIAFSRGRAQERGWKTRRLVLVTCMCLAAAILVFGIQARDESHEGQKSAATRIAVISRAKEALTLVAPFGAGPGQSDAYRKAKRLPGWEIPLENSYAELAVSLGAIGALLIFAMLVAVVVIGLRNELITGEAAALLTILVDMAGFNAVEGHKPLILLIALFVIVIITAPRQRSAPRDRHLPRVRDVVSRRPALTVS